MLQWERVLQGIRQPCRAVFAYSVPHRGRENNGFQALPEILMLIKIHGRALCFALACGDYFVEEERVIYRLWRKDNHIRKLCDTVS